jgi:hypothetical protein
MRSMPRQFIFIFVLCGIFLQSTIAAGYMPSLQKDGSATIQICTAYGVKSIQIDTNQNPLSPDHTVQKTCPYALAAFAGVLPDKHDGQAYRVFYHEPVVFFETISPVFASHVQAYYSRGPPVYS